MRRSWLTVLAILVVISAVVQAQQGESIPIIDAHTHTSFTGVTEQTTGRPNTMDQYFKEWREAGFHEALRRSLQARHPTRALEGRLSRQRSPRV